MNVHRALIVEAIVSAALPDWLWAPTDYAAFDFQHADGTRLEVKQSVARQSWVSKMPSAPLGHSRPKRSYVGQNPLHST